MAKLISTTYGEALFELASEQNKIDSFTEEILALRKALDANQDLDALMAHPKITKEEKHEVINNIFKGRIDDELLGFLQLLVTKDRYGDIRAILKHFIDKVKDLKGIGIAYVTTAQPLQDAQKKAVSDRLRETTKYDIMEMHYSVDKKLIGGMVIRIGDRVVDSSVYSKLERLKQDLLKIQLA